MKIARNIALASLLLLGGTATAAEWQVVQNAGMEVRLYKPDSQPKVNDKRALMISMHGCAVNMNGAKWMQEKGNWQPTADEYGMVVALPAAPNGGAYGWNCWDWKPTDHTRDNYYNSYVLELVDNLIADPQLNIDPDQVYVSGLSSGAGQALILGCLAPDVFAGMGLSAAPPVGNGNIKNVDVDLISSTCIDFAGDSAEHFDSQVTSIIIGSRDTTVIPATQKAIAFAMADIYQVEQSIGSKIFPEEWSQVWGDSEYERVVFTEVTGMGHAWPAGGGEGDDWADTTKINYPARLTQFLFDNNQRVDAEETCKKITLDEINYNPETKVFTASGTVTKECQDAVVSISVADSADSQSPVNDEYSFTIQNVSCPDEVKVTLENASHETFTATDMYTDSCGQTETPPVIESFNAITAEGTVSFSGVASDEDGTVVSAVITIDDTDYDAEVDENGVFNLKVEGLAVGEYSAIAVVMDDDALTDDATTEFTISLDDPLPPIVSVNARVNGTSVTISGTASDVDGDIVEVVVSVNGSDYVVANGSFSKTIADLAAGSYDVVVTVTDSDDLIATASTSFKIEEQGESIWDTWLKWLASFWKF